MAVHVNEVHTDIVSAGVGESLEPADKNRNRRRRRTQWAEIRRLTERCSRRVRAEGFSD